MTCLGSGNGFQMGLFRTMMPNLCIFVEVLGYFSLPVSSNYLGSYRL